MAILTGIPVRANPDMFFSVIYSVLDSISAFSTYLLLPDLSRGLQENDIIIAVTSSKNYLIGKLSGMFFISAADGE